MALLSFPVAPVNGQYYPLSPPPGVNVYQWNSTDQTWELIGSSTGAVSGTYGTPTAVPQITIDSTGRILSVVNLSIQSASTTQVGLVQLTDNTVTDDATTALTAAQGYNLQNEIGDTNLLSPSYPDLVTAVNALGAPTGVIADTYGDAFNVGQFTVDSTGRITFARNVQIALTEGTVTRVNTGTGLTGGPITDTGTISLNTTFTDGRYLRLTGGTLTGALQLPNGSESSPSLKFNSSPTSGLYFDGSGSVAVSQNGSTRVTFGNSATSFFSDVVISSGRNVSMTGALSLFQPSGQARFYDFDNSNYVGFSGPNTITNNVMWVLPNSDGINGQFLRTNGAAQLSWGGPVVGTLQSVTNNGSITTNSITVAGLTVAGITYPTVDGTAGQILTTNGAGILSWGSAPANTLQAVTTAGNITTNTITSDTVTTTGSFQVDRLGTTVALISDTGSFVPSLAIAGLNYPTTDGTSGQVLQTDGAGTLSWGATPTVGTVTSVATGDGITGGPITTTGTISLTNTGASPGTYTYATVTVDVKGRITLASSGTAPNTTVTAPITNTGTAVGPVIGIQNATTGQLGAVQVGTNIDVAAGVVSVKSSSTAQSGIVQLNNTVTSTSETEALTAAQGKALQDQISALSVTSNLTLAGTFNASNSQMLTVTADGTAQSFAIGNNLPAAAAGNTDYFVIVTTPGNYSPPGGGGPFDASQGDWFLSNGSSWQYLNVGSDLPAASSGTAGIVELADLTETQTGTSTALAVTPAGAAGTYLPITSFTAKGDILSASGANTPVALPVGGDNQILTACAAATSGLCWVTPPTPVAAIPCSVLSAKGSLVAASGANTPANLVVGVDNEILVACSLATTGLCWVAPPPPAIPCSCITAKGSLITGNAASIPVALPVGADNAFLMANSACSSGLEWATGGLGDTPVGSVQYFAMSTAPSGWLAADGSAVSRTTYSSLFAAIGTTYGAGDTTTTFNLPDLRGMFARGWDAAGGTARNCDTGRAFGSTQQDALQNITGSFKSFDRGVTGVTGAFCTYARFNAALNTGAADTWGSCNCLVVGNVARTANQTRPMNVAMLPCIKWRVTTAPSSCGIPCSCITGKGGLVTGTAANSPIGIAAGANGQVLFACSANPTGLCWAGIPQATPAASGTLLGCTIGTNVALGFLSQAPGLSADNVSAGYATLCSITTGFQNTAIGHIASCSLATGNQNIAIGSSALCRMTSGLSNDAVGALAMQVFTSGNYNVSVGGYSLFCYTSGDFNTAVGHRAMTDVTTGTCNTAIGGYAGQVLTTGVCNTAVGYAALVCNGNNNTVLGSGAQNVSGASNSVTLGNASITTIRAAQQTITSLSDARDKTDVTALPVGLDFVNSLNPVKFTWQMREPNEVKDGTSEAGFIAQDLQASQEAAGADYLGLVYDEDPERLEASAGKLIPVLVKAIQELSDEVNALREEVNRLKV